MKQIQQGDVQIERVEEIPENVEERGPENGSFILAEGEATGHAHRIREHQDVELFEADSGTLYMSVESEAELSHEEHDTVTIPEGTYEIGPTYEVSPFEKMEREVSD